VGVRQFPDGWSGKGTFRQSPTRRVATGRVILKARTHCGAGLVLSGLKKCIWRPFGEYRQKVLRLQVLLPNRFPRRKGGGCHQSLSGIYSRGRVPEDRKEVSFKTLQFAELRNIVYMNLKGSRGKKTIRRLPRQIHVEKTAKKKRGQIVKGACWGKSIASLETALG